ncbi:MAG: methyltransferase domain-containing protein [Rubrobacteraceae bacterium]
MECIFGKTSAEVNAEALAARTAKHGDVLLDIGTGDGRYVLHAARTRPDWFAIGVDASKDNLRKASRKAPPNALYVIANALALPAELGGIASRITINFPWGSLLAGLLDGALLEGLLAVCRPGAGLEITVNAGALAESGYTLETGAARIRKALYESGLDLQDATRLDARTLRQGHITWAKRLAFGRDPRAVCLRARRVGKVPTHGRPARRQPSGVVP